MRLLGLLNMLMCIMLLCGEIQFLLNLLPSEPVHGSCLWGVSPGFVFRVRVEKGSFINIVNMRKSPGWLLIATSTQLKPQVVLLAMNQVKHICLIRT